MTVDFNAEHAAGVYGGAQNQLSDSRQGIAGVNGAGLNDPALTEALNNHNEKTSNQMVTAEDDLEKGKRATADLDDADKRNAKKISGLGGPDALKNAMNNGQPGGGSPAGGSPSGGSPSPSPSPSGGGGGSPMPQMPQMPQPNMTQLSPDQLMRLLQGAGITPEDIDNAKSDTSTGDGKAKGSDPFDADKVLLKKINHGPLTKSQMHAVIEQALDNNGISKDPGVRSKWHTMLMFMAEKESSFNPNAVNLTDSNAVGPRQIDGAPAKSSRGLWQTIPSTFAAHHVGGTSHNIYDPIANGSSAVNYIVQRYHVNPSGGSSFDAFFNRRRAGGYTGY